MRDRGDLLGEILAERMALVQEAVRLNSAQLLNAQQLSGNQVELLRCNDAMTDGTATAETQAELAAAEDRDAELRSRIDECDRKLKDLEDRIAVLDRKLEAT